MSKEIVGVEGYYQIECRDAAGNLKWEERFPNLVNAVGKELMFNTLLNGSSYTATGPYLGLIGSFAPTFSASDTMSNHPGWVEFVNYKIGTSSVRGTAVFSNASSSGASPYNITQASANSIAFTVILPGGTLSGCFLVLGPGASDTLNSTTGTLYSAGAFITPKGVTGGDVINVAYQTAATS